MGIINDNFSLSFILNVFMKIEKELHRIEYNNRENKIFTFKFFFVDEPDVQRFF